MNDVLGILDSLEATILEGKKIPMTDKVLLSEPVLLKIMDKMRLGIKSKGDLARQSVDIASRGPTINEPSVDKNALSHHVLDQDPLEQIDRAEQEATQIKSGANEYADNVLANLQLMLTQLQKNLMNLERNVENGRAVLDKKRSQGEDLDEIE